MHGSLRVSTRVFSGSEGSSVLTLGRRLGKVVCVSEDRPPEPRRGAQGGRRGPAPPSAAALGPSADQGGLPGGDGLPGQGPAGEAQEGRSQALVFSRVKHGCQYLV